MGLPDLVKNARTITSDEFVPEGGRKHLRVFAGPGAGKTHWIDVQVRGLMAVRSVDPTVQKIACISYTNVAVDTLTARLGDASTTTSVSTFHSFLYTNVVKPYAHLVKDKSGKPLIDASKLDGHDEPRSGYKLIEAWAKRIRPKRVPAFKKNQRAKAEKYLEKLYWTLENGDIRVVSREEWQPVKYFPTTQLFEYKLAVWAFGRLEHDDVLYFSWRILKENPVLRGLLSARFPFVIVDEFQDASPIQIAILQWLAEAGSVLTVVGDLAQSIYNFQGAKPEHFFNFDLDDVVDLKIEGNRRSTGSIVNFLNQLRNDGLQQKCLRGTTGSPVVLLAGGIAETLATAEFKLPPGETLHCLTRNNKDVAILRQRGQLALKGDPWDELKLACSERYLFFKRLCSAVELERAENYPAACRELLRLFKIRTNGEHRKPLKANAVLSDEEQRAAALSLMTVCGELRCSGETSVEVYRYINDVLAKTELGLSLVSLTRGAAFDLLSKTAFVSLVNNLRLGDDRRAGQTIHKAKGAEFGNVYISLESRVQGKVKSRIGHLVAPEDDEEHRITYVGLSRARNRLFIQAPSLTPEQEDALRQLGLTIHRNDSQ